MTKKFIFVSNQSAKCGDGRKGVGLKYTEEEMTPGNVSRQVERRWHWSGLCGSVASSPPAVSGEPRTGVLPWLSLREGV